MLLAVLPWEDMLKGQKPCKATGNTEKRAPYGIHSRNISPSPSFKKSGALGVVKKPRSVELCEDLPVAVGQVRLPCKTISKKKATTPNQGKLSRLTETSILVLGLHYKSMKNQPAHGNIDSSTRLVLQINENPAGSRKHRFQH